jgi:glycosyltransferase involved in cell wall biosynthesis
MESGLMAQSDSKTAKAGPVSILFLSNNPERSSFKTRIGKYLDVMRRDNIDYRIETLPDNWHARRDLFKLAGQFDCVFLHKKKLSIPDTYILKRACKKLIYNFDDAVMYDEANPSRRDWLRLLAFRRTVRAADLVLVGSRYLAEHALKYNPNVEILPLGLETALYDVAAAGRTDDKIRLVWIGSRSTLKYLEHIQPVIEKIGSCFSNVVLRIIGDTFFDIPDITVEKLKWSEQTRGLYLAQSDIGLAPLPDDRFTRGKCSFKVLEYSAAGLPVVASPVGTNAEHIQQGVTGFLVENNNQWIEKITALIKDAQLRRSMGQQGRQFASQFDVSVIGKQLCEIIRKCLIGIQ